MSRHVPFPTAIRGCQDARSLIRHSAVHFFPMCMYTVPLPLFLLVCLTLCSAKSLFVSFTPYLSHSVKHCKVLPPCFSSSTCRFVRVQNSSSRPAHACVSDFLSSARYAPHSRHTHVPRKKHICFQKLLNAPISCTKSPGLFEHFRHFLA
jgi:hypothetical protein